MKLAGPDASYSSMSTDHPVRKAVADLEADVVLLSSAVLTRQTADQLRAQCASRSHEECILILTTFGGYPDAAYLMARFLNAAYPKGFKAFIIGQCKSAGTLLALGAKEEIVMGNRGELGPLDIQVPEKDEPFRLGSGLELFEALNNLAQSTYEMFEAYMLQLIGRSAGQLSVKTAAKIATELAVGIMAPIASQIDPLQLGRQERALNIVKAYAKRLGVPNSVVGKLATEYPDHGFVIDFKEAESLLSKKVREPNEQECALEYELSQAGIPGLYDPQPADRPFIVRLAEQQQPKRENVYAGRPDLRGNQEESPSQVDGQRPRDGS